MLNSLCIIPARGGSKRIPKKNIKEFHGKPIIGYSITAAIDSGLFQEVMVSTDCLEIKRISESHGAAVPFLRSSSNSDDLASTVDVVNEVVGEYALRGRTFDSLCVLYPCAPFVRIQDLTRASQLLDKYECVIPVVKYSFSPYRSFKISQSELMYKWPEYEKTRSQDLEELYHDAGQWYFLRNDLYPHKSLIKKSSFALIKDEIEVQDIDSLIDWRLAELKFRLINEKL